MMVPETMKRLENSYFDLKNKLEDVDETMRETAEYKEGLVQLDECQKVLQLSQ